MLVRPPDFGTCLECKKLIEFEQVSIAIVCCEMIHEASPLTLQFFQSIRYNRDFCFQYFVFVVMGVFGNKIMNPRLVIGGQVLHEREP